MPWCLVAIFCCCLTSCRGNALLDQETPTRCEFVFSGASLLTTLEQASHQQYSTHLLFFEMKGVSGPGVVADSRYSLVVSDDVDLGVKPGQRLCLLVGPEWSEFTERHEIIVGDQYRVVPCR